MNYLIISDIHGSHEYLETVLSTPYPYDFVIIVGDHLYHGPRNPILDNYNPQKVADLLNAIDKPIIAVRGNCDAEVDQMLLDYSMMQDYSVFTANSLKVYLTHGHLLDPIQDGPTKHCDLFISGHTHVPIMTKIDSTLIYNPGSIALPKEGHPNTYGYLTEGELITYTLEHKPYMTYKI